MEAEMSPAVKRIEVAALDVMHIEESLGQNLSLTEEELLMATIDLSSYTLGELKDLQHDSEKESKRPAHRPMISV